MEEGESRGARELSKVLYFTKGPYITIRRLESQLSPPVSRLLTTALYCKSL